jgi:hypothetical protein
MSEETAVPAFEILGKRRKIGERLVDLNGVSRLAQARRPRASCCREKRRAAPSTGTRSEGRSPPSRIGGSLSERVGHAPNDRSRAMRPAGDHR